MEIGKPLHVGVIGRLSNDCLWISAIAIATLATRMPLVSKIAYEPDTLLFLSGIQSYDVSLDRPHFPGYILYIALGKVAALALGDAHTSLVFISVVFSVLTGAVVYLLGKDAFGKEVGVGASAIFLTSPIFWAYGLLGLSYIVESFFATLVALTSFRAIRGNSHYLLVAALLLGITVGIRQDAVLFLSPLWLYAASKHPFRVIAKGILIIAVTCVAWFVPMVVLSGGLDSYLSAGTRQWVDVVGPTTMTEQGISALLDNGSRFIMSVFFAVGPGMLIWFYELVSCRRAAAFFKESDQFALFVIWILPGAVFLMAVHLLQPGHTFAFLTAVLILHAGGLRQFVERIGIYTGMRHGPAVHARAWSAKLYGALVLATVLVNGYIFFGAPPFISVTDMATIEDQVGWGWITRFTYPGINMNDLKLEKIDFIRSSFSPDSTLLVLNREQWLDHMRLSYYLEGYRLLILGDRVTAETTENLVDVVLFDGSLSFPDAPGGLVREVSLPREQKLSYALVEGMSAEQRAVFLKRI